jgi:hypothetical protein
MLVLSRKSRESVVIGSPNGFDHLLKVTVIDVKDGKVKLGIDAREIFPSVAGKYGNAFARPGVRVAGD